MLDGQWQGVCRASDGHIYFFGGSHSPGVSAPFFRYDPPGRAISLLAPDMTRICGEDPARTPTQGKVHSDLIEHRGWLYFGTHLSDYSPAGCAAYTGGHLVGYHMATGRFRDYGVIHRNFTNYSAIGIDGPRHRAYFYATPFGVGDGPHLHRIDLATGENRDLGLVAPWDGRGHGQPCQHLHIDADGACWFTARGERALFVAREDRIARFDGVLPGGAEQWYCQRPIDAHRALVVFPDGFYLFDSRRFDGTASAFTRFKAVETPGFTWAYMAVDASRIYWNSRSQQVRPETGRHETRIWSTSWARPEETLDHGPIDDGEGRSPWFLGDLVSDGQGGLYAAARWYVRPDEIPTIGVNRNGLMCAVYFTALDVSEDLAAPSIRPAATGAAIPA